jgi:predicted MPP superfamily phosphohydrolase
MTRRQFIRTAALASLSALAGPKILAQFQPCMVNRKTICVGGLPPAFEGLRVALLSDFHHGNLVPSGMIRDSVRLANSLGPDFVALGGDYVHRGKEWVEGCFRELAGLRAPLGVFGVLGNHDHYSGAEVSVRQAMGRAGIVDLTNRGADIRRGGESLHIGGVGDLWHERQKLSAALAGVTRANSALLLSHNPDYVERIRDDRVGLVLSGHTHGGQCVFPLIGASVLPSRFGQKYASGLCQGPTAKVFVTTGVGHSFPPVRVNCPAEVALLTLTRRAGPHA